MAMSGYDPGDDADQLQPVAGLLAFALPGAGHAYLGDRRRGLLIGAGVLGLFFSGLLIGGIDSVDRQEDFIWFVGQALTGPVAFGVDYAHQHHFKLQTPTGPRSAQPSEHPRNEKSLGRANELGTLFSTLAGMMNLIAIIDAGFSRRRGGGR